MNQPTPENVRRTPLLVVGTLGCIVLFVLHAQAVNYVVDDAYISFHYARHFAEGQGLVYNLGERVEGYTNFLWVLMLAGVHWLFPLADLLTVSRVFGVSLGAATLILLVGFSARRHTAGGPLNLVAALVLACSSSFAAWSTGGLESTLYAFLLLAALCLCDREWRTASSAWPAAIAACLAVLTRADGFVAFALLTLWRFDEGRRAGRGIFTRATAIWLGLFAAVVGVHVAWRMAYYGAPLPNTSYAKVGLTTAQLVRGVKYVLHYFADSGGIAIPALMLAAMTRRSIGPALRGALWFVFAWCAYVCFVGGDGLAFYRFMGYVAPFIALAAQEGVRVVAEAAAAAFDRFSKARLSAVGGLLVLAVAALGGAPSYNVIRHPDESIPPYHHYDNYFVDRCRKAAEWLAAHAAPNAVVAATPAGAIAYFSECRVIDMLGLTDAHIARAPVPNLGKGRAGHEKGDGKYVLSRRPDYVLLGNIAVYDQPYMESDIERTLCQRSEHELWKIPEFHEQYKRESVRIADSGPFQYFTFYRRIQ